MSEAADPEDVDAMLCAYYAARPQGDRAHGGTVEKFIGDAVVGVFGVPAVHEDDPERAVRAGLRLVEALEGMKRPDGTPLAGPRRDQHRRGLGAPRRRPASGRGFLTGDAVNSPRGCRPPPRRRRRRRRARPTSHGRVIDYEELPPVAAKGKAEPVAVWLAKAPRLAHRR